MKIYLAGPLFTIAERFFNERLATVLERAHKKFEVILPQRLDKGIKRSRKLHRNVFSCCIRAIETCDALVAILDGADADSGTCIEIGYAYARKKPIIGIRTDLRQSEDRGLNLMVANICTQLIRVPASKASVEKLATEIGTALRQLVSVTAE